MISGNLKTSTAFVGVVHYQHIPPNDTILRRSKGNGDDFGYMYSRLFTRGLEEGYLTRHPFQV